MTILDQVILALTIWRENRGAGHTGMQSVANVVMNRSAKRRTSPYTECVRKLQFSSMTAKGDPQLTLYPSVNDPSWVDAQTIAAQAVNNQLPDITNGSDMYYAPDAIHSERLVDFNGTTYRFPADWDISKMEYVAKIGDQLFFRT